MLGRVFAIEEFSTFDGPGIRMTVFMKGCPMRCEWCHNPEGQKYEVEYKRVKNGCLSCGACLREGVLNERSVEACPKGLVRICGDDLSVEDLCKKVERNADILRQTGGGVTFSGGEPLMQADFVRECMLFLRGKVNCALQTCGQVDEKTFGKALEATDLVLYDLKLIDGDEHEKYCGVRNESILKNYRTLAKSGKEFITRVPLIPGVTDTEKNLSAVAELLEGLDVKRVELLPYNKLTGSKYSSLMRTYHPSFDEKKKVETRTDIFEKHDIQCRIM